MLADGDYGTFDILQPFARPVTLRAENLHRARFEVMHLTGTEAVTIDGVQLRKGLAIKSSSNVAVHNSRMTGNLYVRGARGLTLTNNEVTGGAFGVVLNTVQDFEVTHNHIHKVTEDLMRITGSSARGRIEYNIIADTVAKKPTHPDIIQFFQAKGVAPTDIVIRRNLLHDPGIKGMVPGQGIFVSDPGRGEQNKGYRNILIEENLINTASTNTLFVNSGRSSVVLRNNTLMSRNSGGGNIRLIGKDFGDGGPTIKGNAFKALVREKRATTPPKGNYVYSKNMAEARIFSGGGGRWEDYLPVLGSALDKSGYGAVKFLAELQASRKPGAEQSVWLGPIWAQPRGKAPAP